MGWLLFVEKALALAFMLWEKARQVEGKDAIPEWDEIATKNARLQAKIDAEKA